MKSVLALGALVLSMFAFVPAVQASSSTVCYQHPGEPEQCIASGALPEGYAPRMGDIRKSTRTGSDGSWTTRYATFVCSYRYGAQECRWEQNRYAAEQDAPYQYPAYAPPPTDFFVFVGPRPHYSGGYRYHAWRRH